MSVYYKFNSELNFSHVDFDGLHISVIDLKRAIFHQRRLGKTADFDLLISNAQTKEEYVEDDCLISKNTSLIVARVPLSSNQHKKWEQHQPAQTTSNFHANEQHLTSASAENVDLSKMNGTEEDKIQAMMTQSTLDYDPSNYQRVRGMQQSGEVPLNYRCHRCHKSGHWIRNCPQNPPPRDHQSMKTRVESKKMTGIPRSLRENPPNNMKEADSAPIPEAKKEVPEDLICSICKNIFKDAVMIPCCGSSFCDECIRTALLESDDNECPDCAEKGTSPGSLIPNRFLRSAVSSYHSEVNSSASREKPPADTAIKPAEEVITPAPENEIKAEESPSNEVEEQQEQQQQPQQEPPPRRSKESKSDDERRNDNEEASDGSEDEDDNIIVTVPTASQQSGPGFRYEQQPSMHHSNNYPRNSTPDWSNSPHEKSDSNHRRTPDEPPGSHGYNNNNNNSSNSSYDAHPKSSNAPASNYPIEHVNKGYPPSLMSNPQGSYHHQQQQQHPPSQQQQQMYNAHPQQSHVHGGPPSHHPQFSNHGHRFPSGMPMHQQSNYYGPPQQNMRPMRYDHRNMHEGKYHHHHHPMHMGMNDNYGMRYQSSAPSGNLANIVSQNIQQRFGTGIIDDPLEAFNKIMREKEMRRDRRRSPPLRSRSPLRTYSPAHRQKSPIRRRKRSRSFSSSRSYSKSRSRSNDRHFTKENAHRKDLRPKYRSSDRRRTPERSRNERTKEKSSHDERSTKKLNSEEAAAAAEHHHHQQQQQHHHEQQQQQHQHQEHRHERHKTIIEPIASTAAKKQEEAVHDEPPPPGEESLPSVSNTEIETKTEERSSLSEAHPECEKETASSDDTKHAKKSREKKKHKKEIKNRKKKKRERKEKKSAQHSRNHTPDIEPSQNLKTAANEDENHQSSTPPPLNDSGHLSLNENDEERVLLYEPELSKWERDEIVDEKSEKPEVNDSATAGTEITSDIIKRAENAIVSKNLHTNESSKANAASAESLPSVVKKIDGDKKIESVQVTVAVVASAADSHFGTRSTEIHRDDKKETKRDDGEPSTRRTSIKDRLGKKIDAKKRSRSRDHKSSTKKDYNEKRNYQMSSAISSVQKPSARNEKRSARRSRTPEYRRHKRSRTASPNRGDERKHKDGEERKHREVDDRKRRDADDKKQREKDKVPDNKVEEGSKHSSTRTQERDKRSRSRSVSYSPKKQNHKDNDRKRSRSRSSDSRKNRKKKKKEKKTKKHKSRERK